MSGRKAAYLLLTGVLTLILTGLPVLADTLSMSTVDNYYQQRDPLLDSSLTPGIFPVKNVTLTEDESDSSSLQTMATGGDLFVILSPVPAKKTGGQDMLVGYVAGRNTNVNVVISGRETMDDPFEELDSVRADENGIFVWPVPDELAGMVRYSATATGTAGTAVSSGVRFSGTDDDTDEEQVVMTPTARVTDTEMPKSTSLTLKASTSSPKVGEPVTLSGKLTDASGKGVSGASILIEEDDGTGFLDLKTVRTGGDGRYETDIQTVFAASVPLRASFDGDDKYLPSRSSQIIFRAHE